MSKKPREKGNKFDKVLIPIIGDLYHLSWAYAGCKWRLICFNEQYDLALLMTPTSRETLVAKRSDLRHLKTHSKPNGAAQ